MKPKEKAKELVNKMLMQSVGEYGAQQCALICVDEIINHCSQVEPFLGVDYWKEVKQEIEKL